MIQETITYTCCSSSSANIIKNGTNKCGTPQYHCKDCGVYRVLEPQQKHSEETKEQVLRAARERVSLRGIDCIFEVGRQTVAHWIRDYLPQLSVVADTLLLYEVGDVLEIDELWSFVLSKAEKRLLWLALCRCTRQIVAFYIGKRDAHAARQLEQRIPYPDTLFRCTPTSRQLMMAFCLSICIGQKRKKVVRPHTLSVRTIPCGSD